MNCPVCKAHNADNPAVERCAQCGIDLQVHRLLGSVRQTIQAQALPKKSILLVMQSITPILLLIVLSLLLIVGMLLGMRFLTFIERLESDRTHSAQRWSDHGFEQLQQMNAIIKQELDLIVEQKQENKNLQTKIEALSKKNNETQKEPIPNPAISEN